MAELLMPKFGLTMTEGQITEWQRKPGERFSKGEVLFVVETEKVANEVEAEADGQLLELLAEEGEIITVGLPIALVSYDGVSNEQALAVVTTSPSAAAPFDAPAARKLMREHGLSPSKITGSGRDGRIMKGDVLRIVATPLARRVARQNDVDLHELAGSGPNGRIKVVDVERVLAYPPDKTLPETAITKSALDPVLQKPDFVRLATARRVQSAKRDIPHFYLTRMVDVQALGQLRDKLNADTGERARISVTHMLVKVLGLALTEMPGVNRIWTEDGILSFVSADIGMVTETPQGLRIPMFRDAGHMPLDAIARTGTDLAARARAGQLAPTDVGGGVMSISNVGMFGATSLTPIISPPQAMILGVGAEQQAFRPDSTGQPSLRQEICLTLAADHRIIDGADAARFLQLVSHNLEEPLRLLRAPISTNA
ncbi:2-oxo acid dehydrogenase subunit E2 [Agrobacterium rhizogenes]|uniref:dihydrolipoamide acetyltransferase family protein n=1 Tax=Rhizobium rhizogenes TaxID=359 RepID=UPI00115CDA4D|nr:dihydrolipoamide acetyltransferase family protein [Rhizobium rhizogenes]NTG90879.1 2-oxo acid dehydrogenase subunit E2 [Rhizobium rhizogenes]NTI20152.1 2-oxo acid dehydrogenase subunit E2 [Rhizobium rhizogenes]NTI39201.1 2-oxo acid dehydrogenase subunit E2 [Rhizobium rhizogenes]TRB19840.1 2-oxo acid dehydrogenase subunit E2 [Rhizobium rhizogenes]WEO69085.1 dihydrolipoamide acetyltransferase family protein [Rhizobium rhizogenes]